MKKESSCFNCRKDFVFDTTCSTGKYCSNKCQQEFQFLTETIFRVERGEVRHPKTLKKFLIWKNGEQCFGCGLKAEWEGKPLSLVLDHISGNKHDNKPVNLRLLCPNCHAQTDTFCGRNHNGSIKVTDEDLLVALRKSHTIATALRSVKLNSSGAMYERCYRLLGN